MPCLHIDSTIEFSWINDIILHRTKLNADIVFNTTHHQPQVLKIPYRMWIWPWTTLSGQESSFQISLSDILPKLSTSLFKHAAQRNVVQSVCKQWVHLYFFGNDFFSFISCLQPKVVFHWWSSSIHGRLPLMVVFHWRSSSIEGRLPLKVVFHCRLSSIEGCLRLKVVFYWR